MSRPVLLVVALLLAVSAGGCVSLPENGPVRTRSIADNGEGETLVDYTPAGPRAGAARIPLVDNWLTSMTATPLNTYVAREYLTDASSTSWVPERGTVVYGSQELVTRPGGAVLLQLHDVVELDDRGAWRGDPTGGRGRDILLRLVREGKQWRISHPPDRLLIPRSHLDSQYQQYSLYFTDRSSQVLVPEPVYVPRGRQAPTLLVAGLLKGPERHLGGVERTFFPAGTLLDGISVPVTRDGTAEVPLSEEVLDADDTSLKRVFAQLAWTLAQVPGVLRLRVTVSGTQIDLPGSRDVVGVGDFSEYDPSVAWASGAVYGVRSRRVVSLDGRGGVPGGGQRGVQPGEGDSPAADGEERTTGPFGVLPLGPRWVAVDLPAQHAAEVSADGRRVREADLDGEPGRAGLADTRTVYAGGTEVLRPAYDLYGQLWVVDRTRSGARLAVVRSGVSRTLEVRGVSGADVARFLVSRDGTRLVAEVRRAGRDTLVVARVRRDSKGRVTGVAPARRLVMDGAPERIRDIAWRTPTVVAVLAAPSGGTSEVLLVKVDGSSSATDLSTGAALFLGRATRLVTSPSPSAPLYVATSSGRLYVLSSRGQWQSTGIPPGLGAPTFVG